MAEIPEPLLAYFATREKQRTEAVDAFLAGLTDYERGLFCDGAVMGYVRGSMHPRGEEIPLNKPIIADVVNACFAHSDLYPAVNAHFEDRRATVEYFVQGQQPDGSWEQCSSTSTDAEFVVERLAARRRMQPEVVFRLARRTTRVIVEAERTEETSR
jgi:hypothetical protein